MPALLPANDDGRRVRALVEFPDVDRLAALGEPEIDALTVLSRALHVKEADLPATLQAVLTSATSVIRSARDAGLNLFSRGRFEPQATLGVAPPRLDQLQQRTGIGPCIEAARDQLTVEIDDMASDNRWPEFAFAAASLGVCAMLCVPLWVNDEVLGSLSLYANMPGAFDPSAKRLAGLFATHAALALAEARRADQLRRAMLNRDVIGQAKGVLMERHRITSDEAYALLKEASHRLNWKLLDVAESLAATGVLAQP
jgi:GAF domain-containing protein